MNTEYNNIGKISAAVDAKGRRTAYEYDLFGNLLKITYCDNTTETFAYDKEGRNTSATDRMGRTIQMTYDAVGNMLSITYPNTASISYTYDQERSTIPTHTMLSGTSSGRPEPPSIAISTTASNSMPIPASSTCVPDT